MKNEQEKSVFARELKNFAASLAAQIAVNDEWTVRGFHVLFS